MRLQAKQNNQKQRKQQIDDEGIKCQLSECSLRDVQGAWSMDCMLSIAQNRIQNVVTQSC